MRWSALWLRGRMNPFAAVYDRPEIARHYLSTLLQAPEGELLNEVVKKPGQLDVLDLGVGAGRTAFFFIPFSKTYLGIDLSPRMIDRCRERFDGIDSTTRFEFRVGDAARLEGCESASMDVVIFSCNGIDCLAPESRVACMGEVFRVLKPGGIFLFSAHNLQAIAAYFGESSVQAKALEPERRAAILKYNGPLEKFSDARISEALFWDGVYGDEGKLRHVYVRPGAQVAALVALGFGQIRVLSSETGAGIGEPEWAQAEELALHYWCVKPVS